MIAFNNGVTNIYNTPGIAADTVANQPAATAVAEGTLYIQTDGSKFQRSDGTNWVDVGGGGGSTPGIDSVLAVNQLLTSPRDIDFNAYELIFTDNTFLTPDFALFNHNTIQLGYTSGGSFSGGLNLDLLNNVYELGSEIYMLQVDCTGSIIQTFTNSVKYGFRIDNNTTQLGDYNGSNGDIRINNVGQNIQIQNFTTIDIGNNFTTTNFSATVLSFTGANLQATTAGGASGKHLKITLNGVAYKIALLNP